MRDLALLYISKDYKKGKISPEISDKNLSKGCDK